MLSHYEKGGTAVEVQGAEKALGLRAIMDHYGFSAQAVDKCGGMEHARVYRIELRKLTGKHNLPLKQGEKEEKYEDL